MVDEPLGMSRVSGTEDDLTLCNGLGSLAVVDDGGCQQTEAGVTMLLVVPEEELLAEGAAVLQRTETVRKFWPVLQGAKLAFGIGVVIGDVGTAVGLGDAQIRQQKGYGFRSHGGATIGMDGQLTGHDILFGTGILEEAF